MTMALRLGPTAALLLALLLGACTRGPDTPALQADVMQRVAAALPPGTLELQALQRRGSQRDAKAAPGETRRVVYFDADLRLARDYDFGAWDAAGVAGLVSALGTGPKGLTGILSGGNLAGDVIRAHGSALYRREGESWEAVAPQGFSAQPAPDFAAGAPRPAEERLLEAMRSVVANAPPETSPATREAMVQELENAHAALRARLARVARGYAIAAGPASGQYLRFAMALNQGDLRTEALATAGGEDNIRLVRDGRVPLGLAQGDSALLAFRGEGPFALEGAWATMRAIGSLYPEAVHVLVRDDARLRSVADLVGRRVAVGQAGAASRTTALAVLQAHGVAERQLAAALDLPPNAALLALRDGQADALVQIIGFPADSIRSAAAELGLRLLPLDARVVRQLAARNPAWYPLALPAGTYTGQTAEVQTLATSAVLLTAGDLTDAEVASITRWVYAPGSDLVARGSVQGAQISAAQARLGLAVPQHAAAARVLESLAPPPGR